MRVSIMVHQSADGWRFEWARIVGGEAESWSFRADQFEEILRRLHFSVREKLPVPSLQGDENYPTHKGKVPHLRIEWVDPEELSSWADSEQNPKGPVG